MICMCSSRDDIMSAVSRCCTYNNCKLSSSFAMHSFAFSKKSKASACSGSHYLQQRAHTRQTDLLHLPRCITLRAVPTRARNNEFDDLQRAAVPSAWIAKASADET
eukprot:TRINITY_DN7132_c1_g1_i1.p5 TRINITY_DN7132_c1_g1~~TRINITY_DN7132_c1_g1_i1.p5  ORF type:complete len:106 (+),score=9.91 TRINITY_DN7132_c1_g1_i1:1211-1528(+)